MNGKSDSIFKAVTWTILALLLTIIACFAILGNWSISIAVGLLSTLPETLFYYIQKDYGADRNLVYSQETNHDSQTKAERIS